MRHHHQHNTNPLSCLSYSDESSNFAITKGTMIQSLALLKGKKKNPLEDSTRLEDSSNIYGVITTMLLNTQAQTHYHRLHILEIRELSNNHIPKSPIQTTNSIKKALMYPIKHQDLTVIQRNGPKEVLGSLGLGIYMYDSSSRAIEEIYKQNEIGVCYIGIYKTQGELESLYSPLEEDTQLYKDFVGRKGIGIIAPMKAGLIELDDIYYDTGELIHDNEETTTFLYNEYMFRDKQSYELMYIVKVEKV